MRSAAGWLAGWAGLYLVLLLLLLLSLAVQARSALDRLRVEPIPQPLTQRFVELRGETEPSSIVRLAVDGRLYAGEFSPLGRFDLFAELPQTARELRLTAVSSAGETIGSVELPVQWAPSAVELEPGFCLASESLGLLWVTASGTPGERVSIEAAAASEPAADPPAEAAPAARQTVHLDDFGVLDLLRDLEGPPPAAVVVRRGGDSPAAAAITCRALAEGEPFPLAREIVVEHELDLPAVVRSLEKLREERAKEAASYTAALLTLMPTARVDVALPSAHPYVALLLRGWMPPLEFVESTVASFAGLPDARGIEVLEEQARSRRLAPPDLTPRVRITRRGDDAVVEVTTRLFAIPRPFGADELSFWRGPGQGVASRPFLTERDSLALRLAAADRWWFERTPTTLEPQVAVWRGPLTVDDVTASRQVPAELITTLARRDREALPRRTQAQTMRDFVRELERAEEPGRVRLLWRALLALVPVLALVWLLRRVEPFAGAPASGGLLALAAIGGAFLIAPMLQSVTTLAVAELLGRAMWETLALDTERLPIAVLNEVGRALADAPRTALWIALIGIVGAAPLYVDGVSGRFTAPSAPRRRSARLPRALRVLRGGFVVALAALLWGLARPPVDWAGAERLGSLLAAVPRPLEPVFAVAVAILVVASALLVAAGWRGLLFTACFWAAGLVLLEGRLGLFVEVPAWAPSTAVILTGLAALPLLSRLLAVVVPVDWWRGSRPWIAAALAGTAIAVLHLPPRLPLVVASGALTLGLLWPAVRLLADLPPGSRIAGFVAGRAGLAAVLLVALGAILGWPVPGPEAGLAPADASALVFHWRKVVPSLIGAGLALLLWSRIDATGRRILGSGELVAAGTLYAVYLVGSTTTWLGVVPIPLLLAIAIARYGLFLPASRRDELLAADVDPAIDFRQLARSFVDAEVPRRRSEAAIRSLSKQLEQAKISPEDFEKRAAAYRHYWRIDEEPAPPPRSAFALGDRDFGRSVGAFVGIGLALATAPIAVSLYEYLPVSRVSHPFPFADFVTFLVAAILKWGLYALFFGLLFANLRGATGLNKGLWLFLAIGLPFAAHRLLGAASVEDLRPFLFWITQLFVFWGLLGLLAGDLRLLLRAGSSAGELRLVHRLPALYAFGSTVTAALVPSLLAVVAGKLGEVVTFFIETVLPALPPS